MLHGAGARSSGNQAVRLGFKISGFGDGNWGLRNPAAEGWQ